MIIKPKNNNIVVQCIIIQYIIHNAQCTFFNFDFGGFLGDCEIFQGSRKMIRHIIMILHNSVRSALIAIVT